jgi:transcriptional regulator with XRE-family HTH domain
VSKVVIVPSQIRAGRTLVDCSQSDLATAAGVGLTTLREMEAQKRPLDTGTASKIRDALENLGVYFVPSGSEHGPGVCLRDNRPNIIRAPTTMTMWDGLPFTVEWKGKEVIVYVSQEAIEDLGGLTGKQPDGVYLAVFEKHRGEILDGVSQAIERPENFDKKGLHVRSSNIASLVFRPSTR